MSTPSKISLLRRTFVALASATALMAAADAHAQGKVKLSNAGGKDECSYSSMSITPDGSVTVQCSGTAPPPPPPPIGETFVMSVAAMSAAPHTVVQIPVTRSGPVGTVFGAMVLNFTYQGSGCAISGVYPLTFAAGEMSSPVIAPMAGDGICTAALIAPSAPATLGTPSSTVITVGSGGTTPQPPPAAGVNCPTGYSPPINLLSNSFLGKGNPLLQMQASGQVVSIPLPSMGNWSTGQVTFGESPTASTPQPVTIEISINKCPGLIDTNIENRCNVRSTNGHNNSITWFARAYSIITGPEIANQRGYCWGGGSDQYYINARWTYQACGFGQQVCGFAVQYNDGPW